MVQLLFGLSTDLSTPSSIWDALRSLLSVFDLVVYKLIGIVYNVLFNISNASIIKADIVKDFFSRVQLILGIVMIFKISVSLLQYVINPDAFNDKKTGMAQMITRIVVMLAMLTAIVPLNIPISEDDETNKTYNYYLNQHGLLFGTLFSLQSRVLENGVIEKLVLGNSADENYTLETSDETQSLKPSDDRNLGEEIAVYILKVFIDVNKKEGATDEELESGSGYICYDKTSDKLDSIFSDMLSNLKTNAILSPILPMGSSSLITFLNTVTNATEFADTYNYYKIYAGSKKVSEIVSLVNVKCGSSYAFAYFPVVSTICGAIVLILFAVSCLDVAIRALKLVILRLIAPIAIISYIDPKSAEKGAFGNWLKLLVSTYIDLFLRLGIIYFVVFLATRITSGELEFGHGVVGAFSAIIIIIGLFYFARQAPKFITDALGLKGMTSWSGLSSILAAAGTLRAGGKISDAFDAARNTAKTEADAFNQGKKAPGMFQSYSQAKDNLAKIKTGDNTMTYGRMKSNSRKLNSMGISDKRADDIHTKRFVLDDAATEAEALYDSFEKGTLSNAQMEGLARRFGRLNEETGKYELDDIGRQRARDYLLKDRLNKKSEAGKWAKYDDEVQKRVKAAGREQAFEDKYRARLNTTDASLDDLRNPDVRSAMFDQGPVQGVRNVVGAFRNDSYERRQNRDQRRDDKVTARAVRQEQSNNDINNAR